MPTKAITHDLHMLVNLCRQKTVLHKDPSSAFRSRSRSLAPPTAHPKHSYKWIRLCFPVASWFLRDQHQSPVDSRQLEQLVKERSCPDTSQLAVPPRLHRKVPSPLKLHHATCRLALRMLKHQRRRSSEESADDTALACGLRAPTMNVAVGLARLADDQPHPTCG